MPEEVRQALKNGSLFYHITDMRFDDDLFLHLEDSVSTIRDVWDLALIGSERLDVEHRFQQLNDVIAKHLNAALDLVKSEDSQARTKGTK